MLVITYYNLKINLPQELFDVFLNLNKYSPGLIFVKLNKSSLNGSKTLENVIGLRRFVPLSVFNYNQLQK